MSYTKFSNEVEKWLKTNNLPYEETDYDSEEVNRARFEAWDLGKGNIFKQWITDKRYKELISCAHSGYCNEFFDPLVEHFFNTNQFGNIKFLYEVELKHKIRMMLDSMKYAKEDYGQIDTEEILNIDVEAYRTAKYSNYKKNHNYLGDIADQRKRALDIIAALLAGFSTMDVPVEYVTLIEDLQSKVYNISIKPKDLKSIK